MANKYSDTKLQILTTALDVASEIGLAGVSIGELAKSARMSKSGFFAHFKSKENLQIAILEHATERFTEEVMKPSLKAPRGVARIKAIIDNWIIWANNSAPGGCIFLSASIEFDDRPGAVRDYIYQSQTKWLKALEYSATLAVDEGEFSKDADCSQLAFEIYSAMLGYYHYKKLLDDDRSQTMVEESFNNIFMSYLK